MSTHVSRGLVWSAQGYPLRADDSTHGLQVIDGPHHEIHEGSSFSCHYTTTTAATDNHRTAIGFTTPDTTKWGHLTIRITADNPSEFFALRGPTIDDDAGTAELNYEVDLSPGEDPVAKGYWSHLRTRRVHTEVRVV